MQGLRSATGIGLCCVVLAAGCGAGREDESESGASTRAALSVPESVALLAARDTSISLARSNKNFGAETTLDVNRTLVSFDSAALRAAVGSQDLVVSAKLELTLTNNALRKLSRSVGAYRLTREWSELGATWNCPSDSNLRNNRADCALPWSMGVLPPNPWARPASSVVTIPAKRTSVVQFDVTADVKSFLGGAANHGWMLMGSTPGEFAEFASRESAAPPRLILSVQRCNAVLCDDGNACTVDSCDASASCVHTPALDGSACNDGNACTQLDVCSAGSCSGQEPVVCAALDECHQAGTCDVSSGLCSNPSLPAGTSCGSDQICDESGACTYATHVVINEAESSGGSPGDWVELYNAGSAPADVSGYRFLDSDDTHVAYVVPAGTTIPAGGYLVLEETSHFGFGLGAADSVRLFDAGGALVDTYSWTAHAITTYGRCPDGSGAFKLTTSVTKGSANDCTVGVKINEVESNGGSPGDWVELYNAGPSTLDLAGFIFKDSDDLHAYSLPVGTTLAAGAYLTLEEASFAFGLGGADSARLYDPQGVLVDSYAWTAHAVTSYGRCPNVTGAFTNTQSVTKGLANACEGGPVEPTGTPWPGGNAVTTVDGLNVFGGNLSGLSYQAPSPASPAVLWAVRNGPSTLYRLVYDGASWAPELANGWELGKTLRYPDGTGGPDSEGVAVIGSPAAAVYVASERDNDVSGVSRLSVLRFDPSQAGSELSATHEWNLTADLPVVGPNLGLEAVAFVPDAFLLANSFFDERTGQLYDPSLYANHEGGLFLVGVEATGLVYAYALDHLSGLFYRVATIVSGNAGVMDLAFDPEVGYLWAQCDETCGNQVGLLAIDTAQGSATFGRFIVKKQFARPSSLDSVSNEGIALASESECVNGFKRFFWSDDAQAAGHSLRADSIPCGRFVP